MLEIHFSICELALSIISFLEKPCWDKISKDIIRQSTDSSSMFSLILSKVKSCDLKPICLSTSADNSPTSSWSLQTLSKSPNFSKEETFWISS